MRIEKYKVMSNDKEALDLYLSMVEATSDGTKTIVETTENEVEFYELVDYIPPQKSEEELREEEISRLKAYLSETDYVVTKMSEAMLYGEDITALQNEYGNVISARAEARRRINELGG